MGQPGRALAWGLAGLVTGVLGAAAVGLSVRSVLVLAGLAAALLLAIRRCRGRRRPTSRSTDRSLSGSRMLFAAGLVFGAALFVAAVERQAADRWPAERAGEVVTFDARVIGLPERRGERTRLVVSPRSPGLPGLPSTIELDWFRPDGWPRPGETWRLRARLMPPTGLRNPGGWDRERSLFAARIGAVGRIQSAERRSPGGAGAALGRLRQDLGDWLQANVDDLQAAALLRALVVGDRSGIDPELNERLRATGTAHLLAISGLHVSLVAGFGALLGGLLASWRALRWIGPDRRRHALVVGLAAAALYAALTGFALPAQRALLMLTVGLGAVLLRRAIGPGRALLVALGAVLLFDPLAPLAVGFWLSFAAVAVLVWCFAGRPPGGGRGALGLIRAQLVLAVGMLPLNLGVFRQLAPSALPANLVAIPLVTFLVLPFGLLAAAGFALGLPGPLPGLLAGMAGQGLSALVVVLEWAAARAPAVQRLGAADWTEMLLAGIGALWLLAPRGWPARPLGLVLLIPLLSATPERLPAGAFDVHVLDVGDGQAVLVRTRTSSLLYGTGSGDGAASSRIPGTVGPALRTLGVRAPDRVVVPGAARGQSGGLAVARARWPEAAFIGRHPQLDRACRAGQGWTIDGVRFSVLHPGPALPELGGDDDCVLLIASAAGRVLLSGRVSARVLRRIGDEYGPLTMLVVPRQGHRDSLDLAWLSAVRPTHAVVSVDAVNRWGLPHTEWSDALEAVGGRFWSTAECGALALTLVPGRAPAFAHRSAEQRGAWRSATQCPDP
ncbi:DNA internalization-related competence protein ComEC/Rec2 [Wenzhouxiangella sp. XN79A]|uniref:DNA internalization-related competence protein ComEC/Rec2 n=1 Tax=Wenzhouxiangella sp. XN79A TaxID=2724193 RepID=UPI00144A9C8D|nr:DNA internalization-related competence protein ComEC/Rec2 [Wenzhouxiangella sp. XN79A]NKI35485.1 DNA internalization-related competence protein ComEC/Rec2 [Wenzhouxiangella sp. XN79A]